MIGVDPRTAPEHPDGIVWLTREGVCTYLNGTAALALGTSTELALDRPVWELVGGIGGSELEAAVRAVVATAQVRVLALWSRQDRRPLEARLLPTRDGLMLALIDVTAHTQHAPDSLFEVQLLSDVASFVQRAPDVAHALAAVCEVIVPALADLAIIELACGVRHLRCARQHRDGHAAELAILEAMPVPRARDVEVVPVVDDAWLQAAGAGPRVIAAARALGVTSVLLVPLLARGQHLGVLVLLSLRAGRPFSAEDVPLALGVADRAGCGIDNAHRLAAAIAARQQREEIIGVVSHDLRAPLHAIALGAQMIARDHPSRYATAIENQVAFADRLVRDLLDLTALDAGALDVVRAETWVDAVLDDVYELHRPAAAVAEVALELSADDDLGRLNMDRHHLVQALSNIVGNALKFTPRGGRVTIAAWRGTEVVTIAIADTGCGIPAPDLPRVFDRFWRRRVTPERGAERGLGLGLGLAIAQGIVTRHGGTIGVASVHGQGTTFTVVLPRRAGLDA